MAWRQRHDGRARGSFVIDKRFKGIGRIKRSSGTNDSRVFEALMVFLKELWNTGRIDVLERLRDGVVEPMDVYRKFRTGELESLRSADDIPNLHADDLEESPLTIWLQREPMAETTRLGYRPCIKALLSFAHQRCTVGDLPKLLKRMREDWADRPRMFNQTRTMLMSFANHTQGSHSVLWEGVRKVKPLVYKVRREGNPLSIREVWELVSKSPSLEGAQMIWTMALTGMNWREYTHDGYEVDEKQGLVAIHGQKRTQRERVIPLLDPELMGPPLLDYSTFRRLLRRLSKRQVTPHDLRRTFARLLEEAGVVESHQQIYMGHAPQNQTGGYKRPRITPAMRAEDARKIRTHIKRELPSRVDLVAAHRFFHLTA